MKISQIKWADNTPDLLRGSCAGEEDFIRSQVENGDAVLLRFEDSDADIYAVIRAETESLGEEMVVMCVGGHGMDKTGLCLIELAKEHGFKSIRYHAKNIAVQKLYEKYGIAGKEVERVYRLAL